MEDYKPITQSTYALTLFPYKANVNNEIIDVGKLQCLAKNKIFGIQQDR